LFQWNKPQSSAIDDALIITDDNGRIFVGDEVVFDGSDDEEDDETGSSCWDDERKWDFGI
jgi:hypothetical protein